MEDRNSSSTTVFFAAVFLATQVALLNYIREGSRFAWMALFPIMISRFPLFPLRLGPVSHGLLLVVTGVGLLWTRGWESWTQQDPLGMCAVFAEFLVFVQSFEFLQRGIRCRAEYLPGLGALTIVSLVLSSDGMLKQSTLDAIYLAFIVMAALILRPDIPRLLRAPGRPEFRKGMTLSAVLVTAITSGALFRQELERDLPNMQRSFAGLQAISAKNQAERDSRSGFVDSGALDSVAWVQRNNPNQQIFRIEATQPPGYVRTSVLTRFDGEEWHDAQPVGPNSQLADSAQRLVPLAEFPDGLHATFDAIPGGKLFALPVASSEPYREQVVVVPTGRGAHVPIPNGAAYLFGKPHGFGVDQHGQVLPGTLRTNQYVVYTSESTRVRSHHNYLTSLNGTLPRDARFLLQLSQAIAGTRIGDRAKMLAIEKYFHRNFTYSLESNLNHDLRGRSPLRAFLEDRRDAHCEYFATATVLLLRSLGIPCRYCLGYLVYEMNNEDDYYVATNRHAHAWVEAYDSQGEQWQIVEPTPGIKEYTRQFEKSANDAEVAHDETTSLDKDRRIWDSLRSLVFVASEALLSYRLIWLLPLGAFVSVTAYSSWLRRGDKPRLGPTQTQLARADAIAAQLGFRRRRDETCHQFAIRMVDSSATLRRLADWYVSYAELKYQSRDGEIVRAPNPTELTDCENANA